MDQRIFSLSMSKNNCGWRNIIVVRDTESTPAFAAASYERDSTRKNGLVTVIPPRVFIGARYS